MKFDGFYVDMNHECLIRIRLMWVRIPNKDAKSESKKMKDGCHRCLS